MEYIDIELKLLAYFNTSILQNNDVTCILSLMDLSVICSTS